MSLFRLSPKTALAVLATALSLSSAHATESVGFAEYYIIGDEADILQSLKDVPTGQVNAGAVVADVRSHVSLVTSSSGTQVYLDRAANGYGFDPFNPSTTSDDRWDAAPGGNPALARGQVLDLDQTQCVAGDRIYVTGAPVSLVRSIWVDKPTAPGAGPGTYCSGNMPLFPVQTWQSSYTVPVGENVTIGTTPNPFAMTDVFVQARASNTRIVITGPTGTVLSDTVVAAGQNVKRAHVDAGTTVTATDATSGLPALVQALVLTSSSNNVARMFSLTPDLFLAGDNYLPVPSHTHPIGEESGRDVNTGVYVFAKQAGTTVEFETAGGIQSVTLAANQVQRFLMPRANPSVNRGYFGAIVRTTDPTKPISTFVACDDQAYNVDWGYAPLPAPFALDEYFIPWGGVNGANISNNPFYVTPIADNTTFYVDYDANGTAEQTFTLDRFETNRVYDTIDRNHTGARVTASGNFVMVWGQDDSESSPPSEPDPDFDQGYTVLPLFWHNPVLSIVLSASPAGLLSTGGSTQITTVTKTPGNNTVYNVNLTSTMPTGWTYSSGSTTITFSDGSPTVTSNPTTSGQTLTWAIDKDMAPGTQITLNYTAATSSGYASGFNQFGATANGTTFPNAADVSSAYLEPSDFTNVFIATSTPTTVVGGTLVSNLSTRTNPGQDVTYTITATNSGTAQATNVGISNALPVGTTYVTGSTSVTAPNSSQRIFADNFGTGTTYAQNGGSSNFAAGWTETGDDNSATAGNYRVAADSGNNRLRIEGAASTTNNVMRTANIFGASDATISFISRRNSFDDATDVVVLEASADASTGWTTIATFTGTATDAAAGVANSISLTPYINTAAGTPMGIRFRVSNALESGDQLFLDNFNITATFRSTQTTAGGAPPLLAQGFTLNAGETMTATFRVKVTQPLANLSQTTVADAATIFSVQSTPVNLSITETLASLVGYAFNDTNNNGVYEPGSGETRRNGVGIQLRSGGADLTVGNGDDANWLEDASGPTAGAYVFNGLMVGNYRLSVNAATVPSGFHVSTTNPANTNLTFGEAETTINFGIAPDVIDSDGDGIPDDTDNCPTIPNVSQADCDLDGIGNVCDATDSLAPTITVCASNQSANANGSCQAAVPNFTSGVTATDTCTAVTLTQSPAVGALRGVGVHVVTITATDGGGNTATCTANFTVTDVTNPIISTCASSQTASANGSCQAAVPNFASGVVASDNCGGVTVTQSPTAGSLRGVGVHVVTLTATDTAGNTATCTANFTVIDATSPVITTCAANQSANANASCQAAVPAYLINATDNCGGFIVSQSPTAGSLRGIGVHVVTITATDTAGNTATCTANFTVTDVTAPVINTCASNQSANANASCQAAVPSYLINATDNCGGLIVSQSPTAGSLRGIGVHVVTITATDTAGNTATCTANFTVIDATSPVINTCAANQSANANASCQATVPPYLIGATDNCSGFIVSQSPTAGTTRGIGVHVVTITATDMAGNTATCTANFTVVDVTDPAISSGPSDQTVPAGAACTYALADFTGSVIANDNCDASLTFTQSPAIGSPLGLGVHTVTVRATDDAGNFDEHSFDVTVEDSTDPVISTCASDQSAVESGGTAPAPDGVAETTATDNCSVTVTQSPVAGMPLGIGTHVITITATDAAGNTAVCTYDFTVDPTGNPPTPTISAIASPTNVSFFAGVAVTFDEAVTDLLASEFAGTGVTVSNLQGAGAHYTIDVTLTGGDGTHTLYLPAGAAIDVDSDASLVSNTVTVLLDQTPATVVADSSPQYSTSPIWDVEFTGGTDPVVGGFASGYAATTLWYRYEGGTWTNSGLTSIDTADTFSFSAGLEGLYEFSFTAVDQLGNASATPTGPGELETIFDNSNPNPGVASVTPTISNTAFTVSYSGAFDPIVSGQPSDLATVTLWYSVDGGTTWLSSGLTQTGGSGSFSFNPPGGVNGTYSFALEATDNAGNTSGVPTGPGDDSIVFDTVGPTPFISSLLSPTRLNTGDTTVTFNEPVTGLLATEFSGTDTTITALAGSGDSYTITVTYNGADGTYTVFLPAGAAIDEAGNLSLVSNTVTVIVDQTPATVVATPLPTYTTVAPFSVSYTGGTDPIAGGVSSGWSNTELWVRYEGGAWTNTGMFSPDTSFSYSVNPTDQGIYYYAFVTEDLVGNIGMTAVSNGDVQTIFDSIAPAPGTASVTLTATNTTIEVDYTGADDVDVPGITNSDLATVTLWYSLDGGPWINSGLTQTGGSGTFSFVPPGGTNGSYAFALQATDNAGNTSVTPAGTGDDSVVFDTIGPTPVISAITSPTRDLVHTGVAVTFNEPVTGGFGGSFTGTGTTVSNLTGSGANWLIDVTLIQPDGFKTVSLPAGVTFDLVGNPSFVSNTVTVALDQTPPTAANLVSPLLTNLSPITVSLEGAFDPDVNGVASGYATAHLYVRFNGGSFVDSGFSTSLTDDDFDFVPTDDGDYDFAVILEDALGNMNAMPILRTSTLYDSTAPNPGIANVVPTVTNVGFTVTYSGANDPMVVGTPSGLATVELYYSYEGGPWTSTGLSDTNGSGSFSYSPMDDGHYAFGLVATDFAGNSSAAIVGAGDDSVIYDTIPPDPGTVSVTPTTTATTIPVDYCCVEDLPHMTETPSGVGSIQLWYSLDGSTWTYSGLSQPGPGPAGSFSFDPPGEVEGDYCFALVVADLAGNSSAIPSGSGDDCVFFENSPPEVVISPIVSPTNQTFHASVPVTFTEPVTDVTASDFICIDCTVTNVQGSGDLYTIDVTLTGPDGLHTVNFPAGHAIDLTGQLNLASNTVEVYLDTHAPTFTSVTSPQYDRTLPMTITYSGIIDPLFGGYASGLATVQLFASYEGGVFTNTGLSSNTGSGSFNYTPASGFQGSYSFQVVATDNVTNASTSSPTTTIYDAQAPNPGTASVAPNYTSTLITINYSGINEPTVNGTPSGYNQAQLWYSFNGGPWTNSGQSTITTSGSFSFVPPGGANGTYAFGLVAFDNAGNSSGTPVGTGDDTVVFDTTPPVINNCPTNFQTPCNALGGYNFTFTPFVMDISPTTFVVSPSNPIPYGTTTIVITVTDAAGNVSTCTFIVDVVPDLQPPARMIGIAAEDGYIEQATTAGVAGKVFATYQTIYIGDMTDNRAYRGIISFDTTTIPANGIITSAKVRLTRTMMQGNTAPLGRLILGMSHRIGASTAIAVDDWLTTTLTYDDITSSFPIPDTNTANTFADIRPEFFQGFNRSGRTQFQIRFENLTDNDRAFDYLSFRSAEHPTIEERPELIVEYYLPECFVFPTVPPPTSAPVTTTLYSYGPEDGNVSEWHWTSEYGISANSTASTLQVGDSAQRNQVMGMLSFDTSAIPDNATIDSATLRLYRTGNAAPPTTLGSLIFDMKNPYKSPTNWYFGTAMALAASDFEAYADFRRVGVIPIPAVNYTFTPLVPLSPTGLLALNKTGRTQIRLRYDLPDNGNAVTDLVTVSSGEYMPIDNRPRLVVTYRVP